MKFIHAADIHLDSPLRGLSNYEGAPENELRSAARGAFENLIALAISEQVDFLLIAGDLYDGDSKDFNTALYLQKQMVLLESEGIPVLIIAGNHDAESVMTKSLSLPSNCTVFSTTEAQTVEFDEIKVAIHGQGFATKAVTEDLSKNYPAPISGYLNIGMLHTSADGSPDHDNYAPCSVADLVSRGYDYWALGHIHIREVLHEAPWVVFAGNIQGRSVKETGPKGATLVTCDDGEITSVEFRELDVARWGICEVDLANVTTIDKAHEEIQNSLSLALSAAEERLLAVRIVLTGASETHSAITTEPDQFRAEVRARSMSLGVDRIWIEKIKINTTSLVDLDLARQREDAIGELLRSIETISDEDLGELAEDALEPLRRKLPSELVHGADPLDLTDLPTLREMLGDVEQLLAPKLIGDED